MSYYRIPKITEVQRQIITGTLLGGSSLIKPKNGLSYYLSMRGKNGKWLQCKAQEFDFLMPPNPFHQEGEYFRWHSICSPLFNQFYDLFYKEGKRIVKAEVLDSLQALGLMVWFIDAGILRDSKVIISTKAHGSEGTKTIKEYFDILGFGSEISGTKIELDEKSTQKFMYIIGDHIPQFLLRPQL